MADELPFGSWPSPITPEAVVAGSVGLGELTTADQDLWWAELRPEESGRVAIVRHAPGGETVDVIGAGHSARTRVHEYGGGAWWLHAGRLIFAEWSDQRLYRVDPDSGPAGRGAPGFASPVPLTPAPAGGASARYADGCHTADGYWTICVRELHGDGEVRNELVAVAVDPPTSPDGSPVPLSEPTVLVAGPDFVASPRVSPDGRLLCWLQWDHPAMPWDGCELWVAEIESSAPGCRLGRAVRVAGGTTESITQPEWDPSGDLWFTSDRSDWSNLYRIGAERLAQAMVEGAGPPPATHIAPLDGEIGMPAWVFGQSRYAFLPAGRVAIAYASAGTDHLAVISPPPPGVGDPGPSDVAAAPWTITDVDTGHTTLSSLRSFGNGVAFVGGSPRAEPVVAVADVPPSGQASLATVRHARDLRLDPAWFSVPEPLVVATTDDATAHALFYPPANPGITGPAGSSPPLIVMSHGGPTSAARPELSLALQYWTSRGFAVVDVNYRGSTGYGRTYRGALDGRWGISDVDDCVAVARHLAAAGRVDGDRMVIRGKSAGGFTTLCALAFRGDFAAGASHYGVADLEALALDTHKFESRYLDRLIGPYPAALDVYKERSPIHHVEGFDCALIVFQGLEDEVVPPAQAEMIVEAVRSKGLPVAYVPFAGEQHGFRQAANIIRALEAERYFYARVLDLESPDAPAPVAIDNL